VLTQGLFTREFMTRRPLTRTHLKEQVFFDLVVQGDRWMRLKAVYRRWGANRFWVDFRH
jgi:hypothetical protein